MDISSLQTFDFFILAIIAACIYIGWKNGLIRSFIAFFAWVGSIIIVVDMYDVVFTFFNTYIASKFICGFIASIGFYIALVIGFSMLGEKVSKATDKFGGSTTDKVTGTIFGGLCGMLISCVLFWLCYTALFTLNDQKLPKWFSGAKSYKILKIGSDSLMAIAFSEEERQKFLNSIKTKSNKLEDELKSSVDNKHS